MTPRKSKKKSSKKRASVVAEATPPSESANAGELQALQERLLRAQAEMANMRKRLQSEVEERTRARMEALFSELITLHDHLELALAALPEGFASDPAGSAFTLGVRAIHASLEDLLRRFGVEAIQPEQTDPFDPETHEAVAHEECPDLEETRLELLRRGYRMGRRILRPAQVRVRKPCESTVPESEVDPETPPEEE